MLPLVTMLVTPLEKVIAAENWSMNQDLAANIVLDQWLVEHSTRVCGPSAGVVDSYEDRAGWNDRSVHPVPLGIYPGEHRPRRIHPRKRLLFVGRVERRKGIHRLLDVLPALLERHPDWQCDIVGNASVPIGPGETFASQFRANHGEAPWFDRVAFHGIVADQDLQACYRDADLFVAPSLYESFGLIYLEAMQYGVPVVGCRVGGVPEVVRHDVDGLLVPPDDPAALCVALDRLMGDDALRRRLGEQAEEAVRTRHSHVAMAARMVVEYRAAIETHAAQAAPAAPDTQGAVFTPALAILDANPETAGLSLASRALAALQKGERDYAADLMMQALGMAGHPEYYAIAIDLSLSQGDHDQALDLAWRGFALTHDDSENCLVFVATIIQLQVSREKTSAEWAAWQRRHYTGLPTRLVNAALSAIRTSRDATAIVMLECCRGMESRDRALQGHVDYHLGSALKRSGRLPEARVCLERAASDGRRQLMPEGLVAAVYFHLGELDQHDGQFKLAARRFEACLALNPAHRRARTLLDEVLAQTVDAA
jgi:tetratricopeptide (TPR) repeat protein